MSDYLINTRKSYDDLAVDCRLLHEPITRDMLAHDPYTPESADSHSPNPEKAELADDEPRRSSVTPEQLISRLEKIAHYEHAFKVDLPRDLRMTRSVSHNMNVNGTPKEIFRSRAMSEIPGKVAKKARLISTASVQSTLRLQSHHSSSDEEWFEFEVEVADSKCESDEPSAKIKKEAQLVTKSDLSAEVSEAKRKRNDADKSKTKSKKCKLFCCSVM